MLVSLGLPLYFRNSTLPSFTCSSFKVLVDEFKAETASVCRAGEPQNYDLLCHGRCHTGTELPWRANEVTICAQRLCVVIEFYML